MLILGGFVTGVEPRVRYAAELIQSGTVECRHVVGLGSFRPGDDRERAAADRFAPEARHELDLLAAMVAKAFGAPNEWAAEVDGDPINDPQLAQPRFDIGTTPRLTALAARSGAPKDLPANMADTYRQFISEVLLPGYSSRGLLVITSSIYLPYQHMDAVRTLITARDQLVQSVGVPASNSSHVYPASGYLQEARSSIRSARLLARCVASPIPDDNSHDSLHNC